MKSIIKTILSCATAVTLGFMVTCCESDGKQQMFTYPEPTIKNITPERGYTGSQLIICGDNFGNRVEPVSVFFGDKKATVLACKNDMIVVKVPDDAVSCDISVKIWQYEYGSAGYFTVVDKPTVYSVMTDNDVNAAFGRVGDKLIVSGSSFGDDADNVSITVGMINSRVVSVKDDEIIAEVPAGYGYGNVLVNVNGFEAVGGRLIDPDYVGNISSYALQNYCQPFVPTEDAPIANWCIPVGWQFNNGCYWFNNGEKTLMRPLILEPNGNYKTGAMGFLCNQWTDVNHKQGFDNAKMFQTSHLPAGRYEITVEVSECVLLAGTLEVFAGVSRGIGTLPDVIGAEGVAGWSVADESVFFDNGAGGKSYLRLTDDKNIAYDTERGSVPMTFTADLDTNSDVTIGIFGTVKMANNRQGGDILLTKFNVERIQ